MKCKFLKEQYCQVGMFSEDKLRISYEMKIIFSRSFTCKKKMQDERGGYNKQICIIYCITLF